MPLVQSCTLEATRVGKKNAVVAARTYNTIHTDDSNLKNVYEDFYQNITGPFWAPERKWVDDEYKNIPFDFDPLPAKKLESVESETVTSSKDICQHGLLCASLRTRKDFHP